jgi:hypothetical protein
MDCHNVLVQHFKSQNVPDAWLDELRVNWRTRGFRRQSGVSKNRTDYVFIGDGMKFRSLRAVLEYFRKKYRATWDSNPTLPPQQEPNEPKEPAPPAKTERTLMINLVLIDGDIDIRYKLRGSTQFAKLFDDYASRKDLSRESFYLVWKSLLVLEHHTPDLLGMEDNACIIIERRA